MTNLSFDFFIQGLIDAMVCFALLFLLPYWSRYKKAFWNELIIGILIWIVFLVFTKPDEISSVFYSLSFGLTLEVLLLIAGAYYVVSVLRKTNSEELPKIPGSRKIAMTLCAVACCLLAGFCTLKAKDQLSGQMIRYPGIGYTEQFLYIKAVHTDYVAFILKDNRIVVKELSKDDAKQGRLLLLLMDDDGAVSQYAKDCFSVMFNCGKVVLNKVTGTESNFEELFQEMSPEESTLQRMRMLIQKVADDFEAVTAEFETANEINRYINEREEDLSSIEIKNSRYYEI